MNYYKYNFISAEPLFAKIELELSSYFESGAVSNTLFPVWAKYVLDKLGKGSFPIREGMLIIEDYQSTLPPDFISVREARMTTYIPGYEYQLPSAFYKAETIRVSDDYTPLEKCATCEPCSMCDKSVSVVYKTMTSILTPSFRTTYLLKPGNISALSKCSDDSLNRGVHSLDTFDIHGNKFVTNFATGQVYFSYYSSELDEEGSNLIPEDVRIIDAIEGYIKYKVFEQLYNQVTDETYNQIERKYMNYRQEYNEKFVIAETQTKKKTPTQIAADIKRIRRGNSKYNIS